MRKFIFIAITCGLIIGVTACGTKNEIVKKEENINTKNMYQEVLENKREYHEYQKESDGTYTDNGLKKLEDNYDNLANETSFRYSFVDLDQDKDEELVIELGEDNITIINYDQETKELNGYVTWYRAFKNLKENGYYEASGGADDTRIYQATFKNNEMIEKELATSISGEYKVEGNTVSEEEYNQYVEENFTSKEAITWQVYNIEQEETSTGLKVGNKVVKYGTYYLKLTDGTLATDGSGTIEIKEDGTCNYYSGWSNMGCLSFYEGNDETICLKTSEMAEDVCFSIENDTLSFNGSTYQYSKN